jgi:pyridoxamine 5'-phosphate oxidase
LLEVQKLMKISRLDFFHQNTGMIHDLSKKLSSIRKDYRLKSLDLADVKADPLAQLSVWLDEAVKAELNELNAIHLSTIDQKGRPAGRIVLLKGIDSNGIVFFTNYNSAKGKELEANSFAAVTFFWDELQRQVRLCGRVEKVSAQESDAYFASRPRESQIGALASDQSEVIPSREFLEEKVKKIEEEYKGKTIPRPSHWGGYRVIPDHVEFWQGRESRLHDRIVYALVEGGDWGIDRLSP